MTIYVNGIGSDGTCQHHAAAYAELTPPATTVSRTLYYDSIAVNTAIVQVPITITEECCVVVTAALLESTAMAVADLEIERPIGTIRTQQEDSVVCNQIEMFQHTAWEVLPAGTYTYYLMNRSSGTSYPYAAWIKAVASDCRG